MQTKSDIEIDFYKYEPLTQSKSDSFLRDLAKDIHDGKVFTDRHISGNSVGILSVFMPLMFISNEVVHKDDRESKLNALFKKQAIDDYFGKIKSETGKTENDLRKEYFESIGIFYEYYGVNEMPRCINGYPMFGSVNFLSKPDTERLFELYREYKEFIKNWNNSGDEPTTEQK